MKKISEEELLKVQELRQRLTEIISTLGELHVNKLVMLKDVNKIEEEQVVQETKFQEFLEEERVLYEVLEKKYGSGTINLDTGEIT